MANSSTNLDLISASQAQKEVTANALFDASSPSMLFGRRASACSGLTWGYYGGTMLVSGTPTAIANGTVTLTASATNYVEATTAGVVSANTSAFTAGRISLYSVVAGAATVMSYSDLRTASAGNGVLDGDKGDIVVSSGGTSWVIDIAVLSTFGRTLIDDADAAAARNTLGLGTSSTLASDTDTTLAANSDARIATQKAIKAYVDGIVTGGAADVMIFKGVIDCSANPNYPAADAGHLYKVSVAGKIGGASGINVEAGDTLYCITDGTSAGTQAAVGTHWNISQVNVDGAVTGPTSATDNHLVVFDGSTGKLVKDLSVSAVLDLFGSMAQGDLLYRNGSTWVRLAAGTAGQVLQTGGTGANPAWASPPFDLTAFYPGVPTASVIVTRVPVARAITFPASLTGSVGKASVAATAQTDFDVQKNGSSVGTIRFSAAATSATFIAASAISLAAGDILSIIAPGTADATLANVGIVLAGTR